MTKIAIVFPGQGSQYVEMLKIFLNTYPTAQQYFDQASEVLGYNLHTLILKGPKEQLNQTEYTQPAMLAAGVAVFYELIQIIPEPCCLAGHSLGEYTALVCAGSLDFEAAIAIVASRGRLMQEASANGAMAAIIGLPYEKVLDLCDRLSGPERVEIANINSTEQLVISGHKELVSQALIESKSLGAKFAKLLPVSVAAHSWYMHPVSAQLEKLLNNTAIKSPHIPVLQNLAATSYLTPQAIKEALVAQVYSPVQWLKTIKAFEHQGITQVIECGPSKVLSGLIKRISPHLLVGSVPDEYSILEYQSLLLKGANK